METDDIQRNLPTSDNHIIAKKNVEKLRTIDHAALQAAHLCSAWQLLFCGSSKFRFGHGLVEFSTVEPN